MSSHLQDLLVFDFGIYFSKSAYICLSLMAEVILDLWLHNYRATFKGSHGLLILVDIFCRFSPRSTATLSSPQVFVPLTQGQVPWDIPHPCSRSRGKSATAASQRARQKPQHLPQTPPGPLWPLPLLLPLPAPQTPAACSTQTPPVLFIQVGAHRQLMPVTSCGVRQGEIMFSLLKSL